MSKDKKNGKTSGQQKASAQGQAQTEEGGTKKKAVPTNLTAVPEIKHPTRRLKRQSFIVGYKGDLLFCDYNEKYWATRKEYLIAQGDGTAKLNKQIEEMEAKLKALKEKKAETEKADTK